MARLVNRTTQPTIVWVLILIAAFGMLSIIYTLTVVGIETKCSIIADHEVSAGQTLSEVLMDPNTYGEWERPDLTNITPDGLEMWTLMAAQANNLTTPGGIHTGQKLLIPSPSSTDCSHPS